MGIGDWGLGIGDWGIGPIPNPQSPIPNPQSPIPIQIPFCLYTYKINNYLNIININKNQILIQYFEMEIPNSILSKKDYKNINKADESSSFLSGAKAKDENLKRDLSFDFNTNQMYNILIIGILIFLCLLKNNDYSEKKLEKFVKDCKQLKRYNITKWDPKNYIIYISVCITVSNNEKNIERLLLSIINQSFQDYEIIIINNHSSDKTLNIITKMKREEERITVIDQEKNLGIYEGRAEGARNARGEYILYMEPDDVLVNPDLFQDFFYYNLRYNLDIFEFSVFHQNEGQKGISFPSSKYLNHNHKYRKDIFFQPEVSDILFYLPNSKRYTHVRCNTIWNKIIRRNVLLKAIDFIDQDYKDKFILATDDTSINILSFQYAQNFSSSNIPGYLYRVKKNKLDTQPEYKIIVCHNYLQYLKLLFRYVLEFNKDINFFVINFIKNDKYIYELKKYKIEEYIKEAIEFLDEILKYDVGNDFRKYIQNLSGQLKG